MNTATNSTETVEFSALMSRLLGLLTEKEQNIVERRFSLGNHKKETLDKIGKSYSITRERVRQIEAVALKKLARISMDPAMRSIHDMAYNIIQEHGGVLLEQHLIDAMFAALGQDEKSIDKNAMKLALCVSTRFINHDRNQVHHSFWRTTDITIADVRRLSDHMYKLLKKQQDEVLSVEEIAQILTDVKGANPTLLKSLLEVDKRFLFTEEGWGLAECRLINPRSIKDKIFITLKENKKPLHFREIIDAVHNQFESKRKVTNQAVHNELIRHDEFVLVGRGLYGLSDWGMATGTVCDVIIQVMKEHGEPMKRQDIIQGVLNKRDIRVGTISLNLQKYDFFRRVGRAVYEYVPDMDTRRRNKKQLAKSK